ncbi:uncharacterized protein [Physcomitrium patens]|uniref:Uncharacterized protein n=1 Tax=Physcomitrium patens TaxID=3218 RepID=A0A7I4FSC9_PHYPA|nr:uncharacterized protein LOC112283738 isoform X2 [Physcomitrium patens]|eukprot:XP_024378581.1 uncharacterized protein LOC112283738 isoform X2 [Physcomitrella patens]
MDKFVVHEAGPSFPPIQRGLLSRQKWKAAAYQVDGKLPAAYKHFLLNALLQSYSEMGSFPQSNLSRDFPPPVHAPVWQGSVVDTLSSFTEIVGMASGNTFFTSRPIVTCVEFDAQGVYVASVSSNGCLSIHDFETLYCTSGDKVKPTVHVHTRHKLEGVRWNPNNQDEVACVASGSSSLYLYDIASYSQTPRQILEYRSKHHRGQPASLFDLSYCTMDKDRIIACGNDSNVHVWDRRVGKLPTMSIPAPIAGDLNSIQLSRDEQLVFAGTEGGHIILWDLRGGRNSAAFVAPGESYHPPLRSMKLSTLLQDIPDLKAQTNIENSSIHSISFSPSCGHHLGFHLNNGWSGVLNILDFSVTHIHCPPPPWIEHECAPWLTIRRRRPAWLTSYPVYAVGCTMECHINVLDFTSSPTSQCSVNSNSHILQSSVEGKWRKQLHTSEPVVAIAAHPTHDSLLAGTQAGSLLLIAQKKKSAATEEEALKLSNQASAGQRKAAVDVSEMLEIRASGHPRSR